MESLDDPAEDVANFDIADGDAAKQGVTLSAAVLKRGAGE